MFKVSKEILPIPKKGCAPKIGRPKVYPFHQMDVGQHFDAPRDMGATPQGNDKRQRAIGVAAIYFIKSSGAGRKFTTRKIDKSTVRCWRIA